MNEATAVTADELVSSSASTAPSAPPAPPPEAPAEEAHKPAPAPDPATQPERGPFAGQRDSLNREFHSAKFRIKDGRPQVDSVGRFVPLGLGGGPKKSPNVSTADAATSTTNANHRSVIPPDEPAAPPPGAMPTEQLAAEVAINLVQSALIVIGQEEGVLTDFERDTLKGPLSRILAKYNLGDKMTPELEFGAALAVIVMSRLKKPKTMGWFQEKMMSLRSWFTRRKLAKIVNPTPNVETVHEPAPGPEAAADYLKRHGN